MTGNGAGNQVLVRRCESYDPALMERIVAEGMEALGFHPEGKLFAKPNVVYAGDPEVFGRHAYTHPAFVGAALKALGRPEAVARVDLGENSAVGFPTRNCYRAAGYYEMVERVAKEARCPVDIFCMDEDRWDLVPMNGVIHSSLQLSRRMARADAKVYLPKLKCHCVSKMTGAVKLNIGICSDKERSIRHDFALNDKIVDLLEVGYPDFIAMDAIEVGVGNEVFATPRHLGLVILGRNPVAVDLVGARLLGIDGREVPYLARAMERGYGPSSLEEVPLGGDLTRVEELDALAARVGPHDAEFTAWQDIQVELDRLGSPMRLYWGAHRHGEGERCPTGCVMGLKMFLATFERYAGPEAFRSAKPVVFVVGRVATPEGPIDAAGEEVIFIGKCAQAEVTNAKKTVHVDRCFTTAKDLTFAIGSHLGMPAPMHDVKMVGGLARDMARSSVQKLWNMRLAQDVGRVFSSKKDKAPKK